MQSQHVNSNNGEYHTENRIRDARDNAEKLQQEKQADQYLSQSNMISMAQSNESLTGNFLLHSHHPRVDSLPDGGGLWEWSGGSNNALNNGSVLPENGMTVIESFMKFGSEDKTVLEDKPVYEKQQQQQQQPHYHQQLQQQQHEQQRQLWKDESKSHDIQTIEDKSFQKRLCIGQQTNDSNFECARGKSSMDNEKNNHGTENDVGFPETPRVTLVNENDAASDYPESSEKIASTEPPSSNCDSSQANIKQENMIDYGCSSSDCVPSPTASSKSDGCAPKEIKSEPDQRPQKCNNDYKFRGDGGPAKVSPGVGSWCCRRGGTEQPTPEHLREGCCQGLQTRDEILADSADKPDVKNERSQTPRSGGVPSTTKLQDHLDKLKNNVRSEVPDCNCFPADKCELLLSIQHDTNIEREHTNHVFTRNLKKLSK